MAGQKKEPSAADRARELGRMHADHSGLTRVQFLDRMKMSLDDRTGDGYTGLTLYHLYLEVRARQRANNNQWSEPKW